MQLGGAASNVEFIMAQEPQKTVRKSVESGGIALHTGVRATLRVMPAPANSGVMFRRVDQPGAPSVRALASNVVDVRRGTTIRNGNAVVSTVEHLMASLHAAGIDNALVDMDGPEPPIFDGSAKVFWDMVRDAGSVEQDAPAQYAVVREPISFQMGDTKISIFPDESFRISCMIDFGATVLDAQTYSSPVNADTFANGLSTARTFVIYHELKQLVSLGLVKGGSLDNAIIMHDGAIFCIDGLRFPDELVRHKVMDIVGDLYLVGRRIKGHVIAYKPGHPANVALAQKIMQHQTTG